MHKMGKEEKLKEKCLQTAKRIVKEQFEIIITDGILSANSSESHMIEKKNARRIRTRKTTCFSRNQKSCCI